MAVAGLLWACDDLSSGERYHKQLLDVARRAADCEELVLHHALRPEAGYTSSLDDLLRFDASLTDDPQIDIRFGPFSASGYSFTVHHRGVDAEAVCTAADGCRLITVSRKD